MCSLKVDTSQDETLPSSVFVALVATPARVHPTSTCATRPSPVTVGPFLFPVRSHDRNPMQFPVAERSLLRERACALLRPSRHLLLPGVRAKLSLFAVKQESQINSSWRVFSTSPSKSVKLRRHVIGPLPFPKVYHRRLEEAQWSKPL